MAVRFTPQEISQKYNRFARWYDCVEGVPDVLWVRRLRRKLLQRASGKVLEIAVGTGKNLRYYPRDCRIVAVDISRDMLGIARRRMTKLSMDVSFVLADAAALPFPDQKFDTVVSTLTTCTFPEPVAALREMRRVCRPDGRILLVEHGRSDRKWLGRWQDRRAERHARQLGCHWNREPFKLVQEAGFNVASARRTFLGIFHEIEATP